MVQEAGKLDESTAADYIVIYARRSVFVKPTGVRCDWSMREKG